MCIIDNNFMKYILVIFFIVIINLQLKAQLGDYASVENAHYWQNQLPFAGYWQQDVYYNIKASIDDKTDIISGTEILEYKNNSPDTLKELFFHLYQNAFIKDSYLSNLTKNNKVKVRYGKYEDANLGITLDNIQINSINGNKVQASVQPEIDNTILKITLPQGLLPSSTVTVSMSFKSYYSDGSQRRRMKMYHAYGYKHYNGCQWYPKLAVYDRKFGWCTDQHFGREFYGNFGNFNVELSFPNNYIVEATGVLQNETEVLPDDLKSKLDVKNFANKPWEELPSEVVKPDGTLKTWKYFAENVHDFAFTADPTYRIGEVMYKNVKCVAIVQEPHASGWQNAAGYAARIIEVFSKDFGEFAYPKIVVADARDGMEYPMITMDGGRDPSYRGLFVHEIGHNWFYGMVGNNETYRAMLDEGFTQFLTAWGLEKLEGDRLTVSDHASTKQKLTFEPFTQKYASVYSTYLNAAIRDDDGFINTHSDQFAGALGHGGGYGMVYRKTGAMLYNLQYVLGEELFLNAMKNYFNEWKFKHPYPEDFRNSIIHFTKTDLNWFFDQWIETDKKIDYAVKRVKKGKEKNEFTVILKRNGRMQMPVDFTVYDNCGNKKSYHIPNNWFVKKTDATILQRWIGWDKLNPTYKATVISDCGIGNVVIDTSNLLADVNKLNNSLTFPVKAKFDPLLTPALPADWNNYRIRVRPDVWYNNYDGIKAGVFLDGGYFNYMHKIKAGFLLNTGIGSCCLPDSVDINKHDQASFILAYETPLQFINKNLSVKAELKHIDGLQQGLLYAQQLSKDENIKLFTYFKSMYRKNSSDAAYLLYPNDWATGLFNNTATGGISYRYSTSGYNGEMTGKITSSSVYSDYNFSSISFENTDHWRIGKLVWHNRLYAEYGTGLNRPLESSLYFAGANPEQMMDNAFTRSGGFVPQDWLGYDTETNHFQMGGGLNLRGYAGYVAPYNLQDDTQIFIYRGNTGAAINSELDFDELFKIAPRFTRNWLKIDSYLFADVGTIKINNDKKDFTFSDVRADAGLGFAFTIKKWGAFNGIKPLTIRFDMPLFLNVPPAVEEDYFKYRFVIGINRSF